MLYSGLHYALQQSTLCFTVVYIIFYSSLHCALQQITLYFKVCLRGGLGLSSSKVFRIKNERSIKLRRDKLSIELNLCPDYVCARVKSSDMDNSGPISF